MFYITILLAKLISFISKTFNKGAGLTLPGHIILKIYPNVLKEVVKKLPKNIIIVTGTNGKTTTSKLISHILKAHNKKILHNESGSNLLRGIISSVLLEMDFIGNLEADIAVLEVDELYFPVFLEALSTYSINVEGTNLILVLLNISRDQLDRHFEPDIVLEKWKGAISNLKFDTTLLIDKTQPYFESLSEKFSENIDFFDNRSHSTLEISLEGDFNNKNINAALLAASLLGVSKETGLESLTSFDFAYGRGERIKHLGKDFRIFLAKNPASFNNNLRLFLENNFIEDTLLFLLNDNIPDGKDVSWIYDIDPQILSSVCAAKNIYVSGTRYLEMALRLEYSGVKVSMSHMDEDISSVVKKIISDPNAKKVLAFPNYSSMLEIRKLLIGRSIL